MPIVVNTNVMSNIIQKYLTLNTKQMEDSMLKLSTGKRVNSPADDPAAFFMASKIDSDLSALDQAKQNVQIGQGILDQTDESLAALYEAVSKMDSTLQSLKGNDTISFQDIEASLKASADEIKSIMDTAEFNDRDLICPSASVGGSSFSQTLLTSVGTSTSETINIGKAFYDAAELADGGVKIYDNSTITEANKETIQEVINASLSAIKSQRALVGAYQNILDSREDLIDNQQINLESTKSALIDVDVAKETAKYTQAQILQQMTASLLTQANQSSAIALNFL